MNIRDDRALKEFKFIISKPPHSEKIDIHDEIM